MGIIIDIGKLLLLYVREAKRAVENHLTNGPGVVPPPPRKMPTTKRPAPPKGQEKKPKPRKYRLVPNSKGTYTLERYDRGMEMYICERVNVTPHQADEAIAHLERGTIYYRIPEEIGE